jgi:hypothetical protein
MALQGCLFEHFLLFGGLGVFSNKSHLSFNIIWVSALFTIWKDRNMKHFHILVPHRINKTLDKSL